MDSRCLGLHDNNMRCEVITIRNHCYALVSCQIFLLSDHAVGTEITAFGIFGLTFVFGGSRCLFFPFALAETDVLLSMLVLQ